MERLTKNNIAAALSGNPDILPSYEALYERLHGFEELEEQSLLLRLPNIPIRGSKADRIREHAAIHYSKEESSPVITRILEESANMFEAEEEGLLLRLPCREVFETSGDTVFYIFNSEVIEVTNLGVSLSSDGILQIAIASDEATFPYREPDATLDDFNDWCTDVKPIELSEWGKTIFPTKEAAETALAEQEDKE